MSENVTFRSSFNGFNRVEVMTFISELMKEKEESDRKCAELEEKWQEDEKLIADLSEKLNNSADCDTCDLAKQNEVKIGAAMLDARRFSDLIVDEANEKSARMYEAASNDAFSAAEKASELAEKIKATADEYALEFNTLVTKMTSLVDVLSDFGSSVSQSEKEFEGSFDDKKENGSAEGTDRTDAENGWKEPFSDNVFDPDFNFLDGDGDFTIKIDMDED